MDANKGFFTNQIIVKTNNGEKELTQNILFNEFKNSNGDTNLFSFVGDFQEVNSSGISATQSKPILNIAKKASGEYFVRIKKADIFKNETESFESLNLAKDGDDYILKIDPSSPAISMKKKGEELIVEVASTDGKVYKITAGATEINIEYDEKNFVYKTPSDQTLSTCIDTSVVEEFLDKEKTICKTPAKLSEFPNYLIGLTENTMDKNSTLEYGDYQITKIDVSPDGEEKPYLFATHTNPSKTPPTKANYIYINGRFQKCENFFYQYTKDGTGKIVPSLVLEVAPLRKTKNSTMKYYSIPLPMDGDKLNDDSKTALSLMNGIAHNSSVGSSVEAISDGTNSYNFFIQDSREYARDYSFQIKPAKYTRDERTAEPNVTSEQPSPANVNALSSADINNNDANSNSNSNTSEQDNEEENTEENKKEDKKEEKEEKDKIMEKTRDFSKVAEGLGNFSGIAGLFLLGAAALTGPIGAILAPVGLATALGGTALSATSDAFKWKKSVIKKAKDKVVEIQQFEETDKTYTDFFFENEKELNAEIARASEKENALATLIAEENSVAHEFSELFDEFGVGFSAEMDYYAGQDDGPSKSDMLCSYEGYAFRQNLVNSLTSISSAPNAETHKKLVTQFVQTYFHVMPDDKRKKLEAMFETKNQPALTKFVKAMGDTNSAHEKVKEKKQAQMDRLASISDVQINRIFTSSKIDSAQRERLLKNYAPAILRRYALEEKYNETRITKLLSNIPAVDREKAIKIFTETSGIMNAKIRHAKKLAEGKDIVTIQEIQVLAKAFKKIKDISGADKLTSIKTVTEKTKDYFLAYNYAFYNKSGRQERLAGLKTGQSEIDTLHSPAQNSARAINSKIELASVGNHEIQNSWKAVYDKLCETDENGNSLMTEIARMYSEKSGTSILPKVPTDKLTEKKTLIEMAKAYAKSENNAELANLCQNYDNAVQQTQTNFVNNLPTTLKTIERELAGYGIVVDENAIKNAQNKIKADNVGGDENSVKLATIKVLTEAKLEQLKTEENSEENNALIAHLEKIGDFVDATVSGELIAGQVEVSVSNAITEEKPEIDHYELGMADKAGEELKKDIQRNKESEDIIGTFSSADDRKAVRTSFEEKHAGGMNAEEALKEALEENLKERAINLNIDGATYEDIINGNTESDNINVKNVGKQVNAMQGTLQMRNKIELLSMKDDLGDNLAEAVYTEESKKKEHIEESETLIELLANMGNTSQKRVLNLLSKSKQNLGKTLKSLGIKQSEFNKVAVNIKYYGRKDQVDAFDKENSTKSYAKFIDTLKKNVDKATIADKKDLIAQLGRESTKKYLKDIGLDASKLVEIATLSTTDEALKDNFESFDNKNNMFKKLAQQLSEKEIEAKEANMIASLPTEGGKKVLRAQFKIAEHDRKVHEFNTKYEAILALSEQGYADYIVKDALVAFANGNEKFFHEHPEITLPEPYFFSKEDIKLAKYLGVKKRKIKKGNIEKNQGQIKTTLKERHQGLIVALNKTLSEGSLEEQAKAKKLKGKTLEDYSRNLHVSERVFEEIKKETEDSATSENELERLADYGLVYNADEVELDDSEITND